MCEYCIRILRNEDLIFAFQFYELLFSIMKLCLQIWNIMAPDHFCVIPETRLLIQDITFLSLKHLVLLSELVSTGFHQLRFACEDF